MLIQAHNCECELYRFFKGKEAEFFIPKCFYVQEVCPEKNHVGLLILEDLSDRGYVKHLWESAQLPLLMDVSVVIDTFFAVKTIM